MFVATAGMFRETTIMFVVATGMFLETTIMFVVATGMFRENYRNVRGGYRDVPGKLPYCSWRLPECSRGGTAMFEAGTVVCGVLASSRNVICRQHSAFVILCS